MINNKCLGLVLIMGLSSNVSQAAITDESKSPLGCRDQGYRFKLDTLRIEPQATGERQSLYFIFNKLNQPVSLYQMLDEESSHSLALNHLVNPRLWSVLATSEKELKYICAVGATATQRGKIVNCADSLKVCEYARVKFGLNNRGNYWFFNSSSSGHCSQRCTALWNYSKVKT